MNPHDVADPVIDTAQKFLPTVLTISTAILIAGLILVLMLWFFRKIVGWILGSILGAAFGFGSHYLMYPLLLDLLNK